MKKFELGQIVVTQEVNNKIADNEQFAMAVTNAMGRYTNCDWGNMCEEDKDANDTAVESGEDRIFAAYGTCNGKIYIITEWDRSYTTIMFANEY